MLSQLVIIKTFLSQPIYLGAFPTYNGDNLVMELPNCNGDNFQIFLNELSNKKPEEFKVVILDHGAFHKGKSITYNRK